MERLDTATSVALDGNIKVRRVMWIVMAINLAVALAKIVTGQLFGSASVEADGIHSIFDAASNVAALAGLFAAARPADRSHPYGHGKYETFGSFFIGVLLLLAAYEVGAGAVESLLSGQHNAQFSVVSLAVMVVTIVINISVTRYENRMSVRLNSSLLDADSKHTLSDAMVSGSVIVGLLFVAAGFPIADSVAALVVTVAIFVAAVSVFKEVHDTFSDESRLDAGEVADVVLGVEGVRTCHNIRTRGSESEVYADLHVLVDPAMPTLAAHALAESVEAAIKAVFPQVVDCLVHIEPDTPEEREEAAALK